MTIRTDLVDARAAREHLLAAMPVTERRLELTGVSSAVWEGGAGPPVVLLHGAGEFAACWLRVVPDLVKTHHVVVPDLPGHGASEVAGDPPDAARVTAWLGELLERTGATLPALVGHGLGGAAAAQFAVVHGDQLSHLVLVDSLGLGPFRPTPRFAIASVRFGMHPTERSQERMFRQCMLDLDTVNEELGDRGPALASYALDLAQSPGVQAALKRLFPQLALRPIPTARLALMDIPTTLIWGRNDRQVRLRVAEAASVRYGWPLHVVEDSADDPAVEQPQAFLRGLRAALAATGPRSRR
jgi:pimeloyl-ACP methyl ester carboxylesterase